jgi:histone deacetylase 6
VLLGEPPEELPPLIAGEVGCETVWLVAKEQSKYWKNVDPKACEPQDGRKLDSWDFLYTDQLIKPSPKSLIRYLVSDLLQSPVHMSIKTLAFNPRNPQGAPPASLVY